MPIELRRAEDRFVVAEDGRQTRHSFSFGPFYDPANLGFGPMVAHFDDLVRPGGGYPEHPHTDLEIVTWVLAGGLRHTDSSGAATLVQPGTVQVMSAGSGIRHSEIADPASGPTRFVQVWVRPDRPGEPPRHQVAEIATALQGGGLVPVASGHRDDAAARIGTAAATLWVGRLPAGQTLSLPQAPRQHVYLAQGAVQWAGHRVVAGDALRVTERRLEASDQVQALADADLLIWTFRE